jgi:two-component system sensor histidine kinase BaeS
MSDRVWYRSLYWRIALGIIALLIALLVVQGAVFLWLVSKTPDTLPPRALQQSARALALELEAALAQDPAVDRDRFVRDRVSALSRPIVLVWRDGAVSYGGIERPPDWLVQAARVRLDRAAELERRAEAAERGADTMMPGAGAGARAVRTQRALGVAPVRVDGVIVGVLAVLPGPSLRMVLRELGPVLTAVAAGLTLLGTAIAALLIFGPAHRRLRGLEAAARALGSGQAGTGAPESGGDEIASVARSFNAMASEIVRRAEALQAADRARRQLLADVSHELMTPLTAMRGYLETLRLPNLPLDAPTRERYIGIVLEETLRLERIIGDLLDLSRLEAGGPAFSTGSVRVADLFERVRARHERPFAAARIAFQVRVAPGAEQVQGDADRLEQALQNLAANALRHTPPGGRITLAAEPAPDGRIVIAIADTGEGIPVEHLPYVFDRFYKADTARAGGSSGLGLSIVRAIVERHGGTVQVRSTPHVETVFEMALPCPPKADDAKAGGALHGA